MADPIVSIDHFVGINNIDDPVRIEPEVIYTSRNAYKSHHYLVEAVNLDVDNALALVSRTGCSKELEGSEVHSLWAYEDIALFVDGETLYSLSKDYEATELLTGLNRGARMAYAHTPDRIYMTNNSFIGYYQDGVASSLTEPSREFKKALPAGKMIRYYHGRLIVAKGKVLYFSDVFADHYDIRSGFKVFDDEITMVRPVSDGIYVSDNDTWFLSELSEAEGNLIAMKKTKVLSEQAVPFTDITMDGQDIGEEGEKGVRAVWTSATGIYHGDGNGTVRSMSPKYVPSVHGIGTAALREVNGINHYIAVLD